MGENPHSIGRKPTPKLFSVLGDRFTDAFTNDRILCMKNYEKQEIQTQREYSIFKANELVQKARADLTLNESKIMAFIFSKVKPTDAAFTEYSFSINEYLKVVGISKSGYSYEEVKKSLRKIRDKSFWILQDDNTEVLIGWLQKVSIRKNSGIIKVRLDDDIQKYICGLYNNYTQYSLLSVLPMSSVYSIRLFELLKSYEYTHNHKFEIDELKSLLNATHYTNFKDFRRFVLEVAVKEIYKYSDLAVSWEPITKGRKVTHVVFDIKIKSPLERLAAATRANEQIEGQYSLEDYIKE